MKAFPRQRIPFKSKNQTWRKDCVDFLCSMSESRDPADYERMQENYNFHNNVISQSDYQTYIDPLGLDAGKERDFIHAFNKAHNKIQVLKGEELKRPWRFAVIDLSPSASNEILREKTREVKDYLDFQIKKEITALQKKVELEIGVEAGQIQDKEAQEQYQAMMEQMMEEETKFADPQAIEKKYKSFKTTKERLYAKILRHLKFKLKLTHLKNEGFFDLNIAGKEAVLVTVVNGEPHVEIVNPLGLTEHRSAEEQFIHKGDYAVYQKSMSIGEVLDKFGEEMKNADVTGLEERLSLVQGIDAKMASKTGESPSHWDNVNFRPNLVNSIRSFSGDQNGGYGRGNSSEDYVDVFFCYWKSWERIGFLSYMDPETGEKVTLQVTEDFVLPENAESRRAELLGIKFKEFYWIEDGIEYTLKWVYRPQTWEGIRVESDIYVRIRPYPYSTFSESRPFEHCLPIYGIVINARNAPIVSTMDRMKPWIRLYLVVMAKWLKLISQDKGVVQLINELMLDPKVGIDKAMAYAQELGYIGVNPLAHAEGGSTVVGMLQNMKPSEAINLSNAAQLVHYIDILRYIEEEIGDSAGISKPREGQTTRGTNVSDNQQDIAQSATISEPVFAAHDILWTDVLNGIIKVTEKLIKNGEFSNFKRVVLSDEEIAALMVSPEDGDCDMMVAVGNNGKAYQVLEVAKSNAQALIQNDKVTLSGLVKLLNAEDIQEFDTQITEIENSIYERQAAAEQAQREHEEAMQERQLAIVEDQQNHEKELKMMDIEGELAKEEIRAIGNATIGTGDNDLDNNNVPDVLEIEKLRSNERLKSQEIALKARELTEKIRSNKENEKLKSKEITVKRAQAAAKKKAAKKKK